MTRGGSIAHASRARRDMSLSKSEESFGEHYEEREQIGKGAFSVVVKIVHRQSGEEFAAKSIDLRPLRLRPLRLLRPPPRRLHK